jgi:hypothetical protein
LQDFSKIAAVEIRIEDISMFAVFCNCRDDRSKISALYLSYQIDLPVFDPRGKTACLVGSIAQSFKNNAKFQPCKVQYHMVAPSQSLY